MLISDLCDYSNIYFVVNEVTTTEGTNSVKWHQKICGIVLGWTTLKQYQVHLFSIRQTQIERTPANINTLKTKVVVPLKYLGNLRRSLYLLLINC